MKLSLLATNLYRACGDCGGGPERVGVELAPVLVCHYSSLLHVEAPLAPGIHPREEPVKMSLAHTQQ